MITSKFRNYLTKIRNGSIEGDTIPFGSPFIVLDDALSVQQLMLVLKEIHKSPKVTTLQFDPYPFQYLSGDVLKATVENFFKHLRANSSIHRLVITNYYLPNAAGNYVLNYILQNLINHPKITSLEVNLKELQDPQVFQMFLYLLEKGTHIQSLYLAINTLGEHDETSNQRMKQLMTVLSKQNHIKTIYFQGNAWQLSMLKPEDNIKPIAAPPAQFGKDLAGLFANQSLEKLSMVDCALDAKTLAECIGVLANNKTLKALRLKANNITSEASESFAKMLASNQHLKFLDLSFNPLKKEFIPNLSKALGINKTLESLHLQCCQITEIDALAESIAKNTQTALVDLNLAQNRLSEGGTGILKTSSLAMMLSKNKTIKSLNLSGTNLVCEDVMGISRALEDNFTLESLDLSMNQKIFNETISTDLHMYNQYRPSQPRPMLRQAAMGAILDGVEFNASLKELDTSDTGVTPKEREKIDTLLQWRAMADAYDNCDQLPAPIKPKTKCTGKRTRDEFENP